MRIFLSGPMGSGKSTVARVVAARSGLPLFDLDQVIEQRAGKSVAALFAEQGEEAFRKLERVTVRELLAQHERGVFALGGGTVSDRELRRELLTKGVLIGLRAELEELARRVDHGRGRPLLAGQNVTERLRDLIAVRASAYAECHRQIDTDGRHSDAIADDALALAADPPIVVPLGERSYRVEVGPGVRVRLPTRVAQTVGPGRVVLVSDEVVGPLLGQPLAAQLRIGGRSVVTLELPAGEEHKNIESVERIWRAALDAGIDRSSMVVGVAGGVVGDLAGFAAATLLRGIAIGQVPTTLLAMVDSAIGGKTGFDTTHGKNLIGAFHQPSFVLCDIDVLATLPEAERRAGLAEVVKSAWIEGEAAVAELERDADALLAGEAGATSRAIRMAAAMKARVVTEDEREGGLRAVLNLGHTVGHAIEAQQGFRNIRHGEAVALGMVAAFRLANRLGAATQAELERVTRLLVRLGLPTDVSPHLHGGVLTFIGADKKRKADRITFVVPGAPGQVELRTLPLLELPALLR